VDALHEVIQQAWTSDTLPRSWTEGVLCPVYKKGDKLDKLTNNRHNLQQKTKLLAYADDIDSVGRSQSAVRDAFLALEREAAKVGLQINEQKWH
jgi:hypothetical protein